MASGFLDEEIQSMDAKLRELQTKAEITRLQTEISMLEQQCQGSIQQFETPVRPNTNARREALGTGFEMPQPSQARSHINMPLQTPFINGSQNHDLEPIRPSLIRSNVLKQKQLTSTPKPKSEEQVSKQTQQNSFKQTCTKVKPATYDGKGSWNDYKAHFEACSKINCWSNEEKGLYLSVSLRGQAQGILSNLAQDSNNFDKLMTALKERFAPPNQEDLHRAQLRERRQKASESLSEMAQDIRRLVNLAYPSAPADLRDVLAKEQFIDSLASSDMRLRVKQNRPKDLNDAVRHAIELEAFIRAERKITEGKGYFQSVGEPSYTENTDKLASDVTFLSGARP